MKVSSRTRTMMAVFFAAFLLFPALQVPAAGEDAVRSVTYEFDFSEPYVDLGTSERLYGIAGLQLDGRGGVPALPVSPLFLAVPPGNRFVDLQVSCAPVRTIAYMEAYPTNPAEMALSDGRSFSHVYQARWWDQPTVYKLEGVEVLCLNLRPLLWDQESGMLSFVNHYSITLSYEGCQTGFLGDMDRVRGLVNNPQAVPDLPRSAVPGLLPIGKFDHLIITSQQLSAPFLQLAEWKNERNELGSVHDNIRSTVVTLDYILGKSDFWGNPRSHGGKGNDTQTIVRNFIIAAYQEWGVRYVLIGGDDDVIPTRMVKAPVDGQDFKELAADIYYSGLDGDWDADGDGVYGELFLLPSKDEADLLAEVYVGRATVSTEKEAWNFVNKTIRYEMGYSNQFGVDVLLIGEKLDDRPTYGDAYKEEVWNKVLADEGLDRSTLYAKDGTFSASAVLAAMGSGVHIINHMGHGNFGTMAGLYNEDVRGLDNQLPFILYTQACNVAGFDEKRDQPGDCIAEEFVQGEGGAVAFIGNSRYGWYSPGSTDGSSQKFDLSFFSQIYDDDVTELGRALSFSKEEWASAASSAGTVRWVYLELNLLGDPETRVHVPGRAVHDLAVAEMDADRAVLGEPCKVTIRAQNRGQSDDSGTLVLLADKVEVASVPISLSPGESVSVALQWIPERYSMTELTARVICAEDLRPDNDRMVRSVMVDRRVVGNEIWTGDMILPGGFIIDPMVTVEVEDCRIVLQPSNITYRFSVHGSLSFSHSSVQGSSFVIDSIDGDLFFDSSILVGMPTSSVNFLTEGSLAMVDTEVIGGSGWTMEGTAVVAENVTLADQSGGWIISNSTVDIRLLSGIGGAGIHLRNMSGRITSSSWTGGSSGLSLECCSAMTLRDLSFLGNGMDLGIFGEEEAHFNHLVEEVSLTYGPLQVFKGLTGTTIEETSGSMYLIGCRDILVRSSQFGSSGNGLALISSFGIEMVGNSFENCTTGILAIDSEGTAWGNDLLYNKRQVELRRSEILFGRAYPMGGNHWSDHDGTDIMKGEEQNVPGVDGVFDAPYDQGDAFDRYPKVARCSLVHDRLEASFTPESREWNRVDVIHFLSTSNSGIGVANWTWDLGDGGWAYGPFVEHVYSVLGTVMVNLTVTDHYGRMDSAEIDVRIVNLDPVCDFSLTPAGPAPGELVKFTDLSMDLDGGITTWYWEFGDGGTSDMPSPEHVFVNEGNHLVSLTVWDADGGVGKKTRLLVVGNDPPVAAFTWNPVSVTALVDVQFTSTSSDPDGVVVSWSWDFGDGNYGSGQTVKHRYSSLGTYSVTLMVTDDDGSSASLTKTLTVINSRPVASFTFPAEVLSLTEVCFADRSYDLDGSIRNWSWTFGDGGVSSSQSPTHTYLRPGTYPVELIVTDDRGWMGRSSSSIIVTNRPPEVTFTGPPGNYSSLDILKFNASGRDPDGMVVNYTWDMGDGTMLEGQNVTYAYLAPGRYNVTVTCRDDQGAKAWDVTEITIKNLLPSAKVLLQKGDHPLELVFTALANDADGDITSFNWSFGDGTYGQGAVVTHRYAQEGDYTVKLVVTDDAGGMAEDELSATVHHANVFLSAMRLNYVQGLGWELIGEIWNEGDLPVNVTLSVDAGGIMYLWEAEVGGTGFKSFDLPLIGFNGGNVNATLLTPEGWENDLEDNVWMDDVEPRTPLILWIVGAAAIFIAGVAVVLYARRRG